MDEFRTKTWPEGLAELKRGVPSTAAAASSSNPSHLPRNPFDKHKSADASSKAPSTGGVLGKIRQQLDPKTIILLLIIAYLLYLVLTASSSNSASHWKKNNKRETREQRKKAMTKQQKKLSNKAKPNQGELFWSLLTKQTLTKTTATRIRIICYRTAQTAAWPPKAHPTRRRLALPTFYRALSLTLWIN